MAIERQRIFKLCVMCTSNEHFEADVTDSRGSIYRVTFGQLTWEEKNKQDCEYGWMCSCKAFQFRGTCKHICRVSRDIVLEEY